MDTCDVLIVGGGPAGSTCAWKLRAAGLDVIVLDKKPFPRDKTCGGWITPAVVQELELDQDAYARTHIFQAITGFRIGLIGEHAAATDYTEPISFGIRRCEFDDYLLKRSGARLRLGERLNAMERLNGQWIINNSIKTPMVVGAGGHFCPVARMLGAPTPIQEHVVAAQEIEFELKDRQLRECAVEPPVPELYFCQDLRGYGWCFRKENHLNVGLGREDDPHVHEHVTAFCNLMKKQGRIPSDTPEQLHGHAYILRGHTPRKILDDGVLLIGDAAGLAYSKSGEGIRPAVESGLIASQAIIQTRGDYRAQSLQPFVARLEQRFGREDAGQHAPFPSHFKQRAAAYLLATRWFPRHIVLNRWFLHLGQRPLSTAPSMPA